MAPVWSIARRLSESISLSLSLSSSFLARDNRYLEQTADGKHYEYRDAYNVLASMDSTVLPPVRATFVVIARGNAVRAEWVPFRQVIARENPLLARTTAFILLTAKEILPDKYRINYGRVNIGEAISGAGLVVSF